MRFRHRWSMRALACLLGALAAAFAYAEEEPGNMVDSRNKEAGVLMMDFAERTGLSSGRPGTRYLWTDAFALCNFIGLARTSGDTRYQELALRLVDQVHHTLGRHRNDDPRSGWISGLSEREGEIHPTRGGLRIGKPLPERAALDPFDERLEWERDGQYFHYLSKWMHALDQLTRATKRPHFNLWARELAESAHKAFVHLPSASRPRGMYWKMSIDLSRPLVTSMGQHDPLDGYITYIQLRSTASALAGAVATPELEHETGQLARMVRRGEWATADPLGLGGLLSDAHRVQRLMQQGARLEVQLLESLLSASLAGVQYYAQSGDLDLSAEYRLAFRELGLAIGLHAVRHMWQAANRNGDHVSTSPIVRARLEALLHYAPVADAIIAFWRDPGHRRASSWAEHRDINEVMLATSLAPDGFLSLPAAD